MTLHVVCIDLGRYLHSVDLRGCKTIAQLQQRVRDFATERPGSGWIVGSGWDQQLLGRYPTRHDIDAAVSDRPVHLSRVCCHASVENSLAIKLAGSILIITACTVLLSLLLLVYLYYCIISSFGLRAFSSRRCRL